MWILSFRRGTCRSVMNLGVHFFDNFNQFVFLLLGLGEMRRKCRR